MLLPNLLPLQQNPPHSLSTSPGAAGQGRRHHSLKSHLIATGPDCPLHRFPRPCYNQMPTVPPPYPRQCPTEGSRSHQPRELLSSPLKFLPFLNTLPERQWLASDLANLIRPSSVSNSPLLWCLLLKQGEPGGNISSPQVPALLERASFLPLGRSQM